MPYGISKKTGRPNAWKGDEAGYGARHDWIRYHFGRPKKCDDCGTTKIPKGKKWWFEWANISGKYKRKKSDWKRLCRLCHCRMDSHLRARGEKHGIAKLNQHQVRRIRLIGKIKPILQQYNIAKMFKVSTMTVNRVLLRKTWSHII